MRNRVSRRGLVGIKFSREALLAEIVKELTKLEGTALDQFLADIGEDPNQLLSMTADAKNAAVVTQDSRPPGDSQ